MARNLNIGLWGIDIPNISNPISFNWVSQDRLRITGQIKELASLEASLASRDQLLGQQKRPGHSGLVAVHSILDPTVDGYYILENATVAAQSSLGSLANSPGLLPYSADLTRLNTVMFESILSGGVLTNDHSISAGTPWFTPPAHVSSVAPFGGPWGQPGVRDYDALDSDYGPTNYVALYPDVSPPTHPIWTVDPRGFYLGASRLYANGYVITGNPTFSMFTFQSPQPAFTAQNWMMTNGVIRVEATDTYKFEISIFDGTVWEGVSEWEWVIGNISTPGWWHLQVLRNDPEEVSIRLFANRRLTSSRVTLDLSLRRGSRYVRGYMASDSTATNPLTSIGLKRTSSDPATTFTYGIYDTNSIDTHKWVIGSRTNMTEDTTNGGVTGDSDASGGFLDWDFFLGIAKGGDVSSGHDGAIGLGDQYIHHISERVFPVVPGGIIL